MDHTSSGASGNVAPLAGPFFRFRLYVAGEGPNSVRARANLEAICREHLPQRHEIEVIDVTLKPQRALEEGVMLTPLLIKLAPAPELKIFGNLGEEKALLRVLDLAGSGD